MPNFLTTAQFPEIRVILRCSYFHTKSQEWPESDGKFWQTKWKGGDLEWGRK